MYQHIARPSALIPPPPCPPFPDLYAPLLKILLYFCRRQVLRACDVEFETYDVLTNPAVREAIKVRQQQQTEHVLFSCSPLTSCRCGVAVRLGFCVRQEMDLRERGCGPTHTRGADRMLLFGVLPPCARTEDTRVGIYMYLIFTLHCRSLARTKKYCCACVSAFPAVIPG